jgi:hypothetical protein
LGGLRGQERGDGSREIRRAEGASANISQDYWRHTSCPLVCFLLVLSKTIIFLQQYTFDEDCCLFQEQNDFIIFLENLKN